MAVNVEMNMEHSRAQLEVFGLSVSTVIPAALNTIIQLDVPDTLAAADSPLSAQDILNSLPHKTGAAASAKNLERLLRILTFKGTLAIHTCALHHQHFCTLALVARPLIQVEIDRLQPFQQRRLSYVFFSNSHIEHFIHNLGSACEMAYFQDLGKRIDDLPRASMNGSTSARNRSLRRSPRFKGFIRGDGEC
jgi:hypothetical protein